MRVVVTGGAGFIGSNLCRTLGLLVGVDHVIALDDFSTGRKENLVDQPGVELVEGTILDPGILDSVLDGADTIVHLAARPSVPRSIAEPLASHETNATGTVMVLEAARRAGTVHVIVASSSSVYGANPALPKHEDLVPMPLSPYAASKLAGESYALAWAGSFGQEVLVLRFFNVFGPGQTAGHAYAAVVPSFVEAALAGRPLLVHGDGLQTRDFTYVGDVASVLGDAVARGVTSDRPVNLAFGSTVSLRELIEQLEALLGRALTIEHADPRPGDVRHSTADQTRLRLLFPDIEPVSLADGLRATIAWFQRAATV
ncbi:MAG: NAD-dependent epimerase/dehydratase family protein [Actinomycetota bacterium]|nr:NAD-dependent epimerase/dehydratase family protein [Actinomycetota bacterium]